MNLLSKCKFALARARRSFERAGAGGLYRGLRNAGAGVLFDLYHGVDTDTLWTRYSLPPGYDGAWEYGPAKVADLQAMLRKLSGIRHEDFVFLDVGSGKGRALLIASSLPFKKVIGVELSPELHALASRNIGRFRGGTRKCPNISSYCGDATIFPLPSENTVLFLYNPFKAPVMERFLAHVRDSLAAHPRDVYILYLKPLYHDLLVNTGWLRLLDKSDSMAVYCSAMNGSRDAGASDLVRMRPTRVDSSASSGSGVFL